MYKSQNIISIYDSLTILLRAPTFSYFFSMCYTYQFFLRIILANILKHSLRKQVLHKNNNIWLLKIEKKPRFTLKNNIWLQKKIECILFQYKILIFISYLNNIIRALFSIFFNSIKHHFFCEDVKITSVQQ